MHRFSNPPNAMRMHLTLPPTSLSVRVLSARFSSVEAEGPRYSQVCASGLTSVGANGMGWKRLVAPVPAVRFGPATGLAPLAAV